MKRTAQLHTLLTLTTVALLTGCASSGQQAPSGVKALHTDGSVEGGLSEIEYGKLQLVSKTPVSDAQPGLIADVAAHPGKPYAYLARWGGAQCEGPEKRGQQLPDGGAYVMDLTDVNKPTQVGFIPVHQDTLVGEGLQVLSITTPKFKGDILVMNHESCGKNHKGGFSIVDVTNPRKPMKLAMHEGDVTINGSRRGVNDRNMYHSVFAWTMGTKAYLVATDNMESSDVDIFEITDPRHPKLIAELNLNDKEVAQPEIGLVDSFLHDMVVKKISETYVMLLSYWDGGYIMLNVNDPANPQFMGHSEYEAIDPELKLHTGATLTPEGNAHQAEFTADNRYVIATDEDFDPYRLQVNTIIGSFNAKLGTNTNVTNADKLVGTPVFVGLACTAGTVPPASGGTIAVVERGGCFFEDKAQNVIAAQGYTGMLIMNREGKDACAGVFSPFLTAPLPTAFIGRDAGFALFGKTFDAASCLDGTPELSGITPGAIGSTVNSVTPKFDGWGYVQLFGVNMNSTSATFSNLDTFAIPEAMQERFANGHGDLSVHEVATDPKRPNTAYLSYYSGGVRLVEIHEHHGGKVELHDEGGYVHPESTYWGIEVWEHPVSKKQYVLASDRNSGLHVFRHRDE